MKKSSARSAALPNGVGTLREVRRRVTRAFSVMRQRGYVAKQSFLCCGTCAGAAIAGEVTTRLLRGETTKESICGCVTYRRQTAESRDRGYDWHVSYGPVHTQTFGVVGRPAEEVGEEFCVVLKQYRIPHEWNGNPNSCVAIRGRRWSSEILVGKKPVAFRIELNDAGTGAFLAAFGASLNNTVWNNDPAVKAIALEAFLRKEAMPLVDFLQENYPAVFDTAVASR